MVVNQITTAVGTHHRGFLAIHFVYGQVVPVHHFFKVLGQIRTEGEKERNSGRGGAAVSSRWKIPEAS
jgi:hypothetical protein